MSITFKVHQPTGRYRSFDHIFIDIKLNKQKVGSIGWRNYMEAEGKKDGMRVTFHVKSNTDASGWKNVTLRKEFEGFGDTEQGKAAKEWVKNNWETISKQYEIVPLPD